MAKKNKGNKISGDALIARNKRATFDYKVDEKFEAGLVLQGWEVKCLHEGRVQLVDGYVQIVRGEAWLYGCNINPLNSTSNQILILSTIAIPCDSLAKFTGNSRCMCHKRS